MAARRDTHSQNLDSLLDTMANVVGILVVLMAVTQLSVGDAMKRIHALASDQGRLLQREGSELERRWGRAAPAHREAEREIAALREDLRLLRTDSEARRSVPAAALEASLARRRLSVRRLEAGLQEQRETLARLRLGLSTPDPARTPDPLELRLPDPRPAPPDSGRVIIFCRHGRVLDPGFVELEVAFSGAVVDAMGGRSSLLGGEDLAAIAGHFRERDVGSRELRWTIVPGPGGGLGGRLEWRRRDAGETRLQLLDPSSRFRRDLLRHHPGRDYLVFYVWSDSFDAYLAARGIAEEAGFAAGWLALEGGAEPVWTRTSRDPNPIPLD
jgi:hypothetical protein